MEKKLQEYRLRKRRKEKITEIKRALSRFLMFGNAEGKEESQTKTETHSVQIEEDSKLETKDALKNSDSSLSDVEDLLSTTDQEDQDCEESTISPDAEDTESRRFRYALWTIGFLFWLTLYMIAIELQFGIVFLMFSALLGIYFNTRTGKKRKNEISAYSVFNKNCESIDGTLKAEQFEREIRFGPGYVR